MNLKRGTKKKDTVKLPFWRYKKMVKIGPFSNQKKRRFWYLSKRYRMSTKIPYRLPLYKMARKCLKLMLKKCQNHVFLAPRVWFLVCIVVCFWDYKKKPNSFSFWNNSCVFEIKSMIHTKKRHEIIFGDHSSVLLRLN